MSTLLRTALLLLTGFAFNHLQAQFTIVGNIQHLDNQWVYLRYVNDSLIKQTDSVYAWEGRFVMRGNCQEPTHAYLRSQDKALDYDFFFETGNTILTGDLKISGDNYMVYGGKTTKGYAGFKAVDKPYLLQRDSLMQQTNKQRLEGDTLGAVATQNYLTEIIDQSKKLEREFLAKNGHSPVSAYLIGAMYVHPGTWAKGDSLLQLLSETALQSKYVRLREMQIAKIRKLEPGKPMVPFSQKDKNGNRFSTSLLKGRYYLIEFWASWCAPCRKENPALRKVYLKYNPKGFEIIGVSLDTDRNAWLSAITKDQLPWVQVSDLKGWDNTVARTYEVNMIPFNFLIDSKGNIIAHSIRPDELSKKLAGIYRK
jgi:peroxiredoxin